MENTEQFTHTVDRFLTRVCEISEGSPKVFVNEEAVAKDLGITLSEMAGIVDHLKERGLVEGAGVFAPAIVITPLGARMAKRV